MLGFRSKFLPRSGDNRMKHEGDLALARRRFLENSSNNLRWLLKKRFDWMDDYIVGTTVYEIGAGAGFSRFFIKNPNLKLTDVKTQSWIDLEINALAMPFPPNSVDTLICSHMIHHLANPHTFFLETLRVLRSGGRLVIVDINTSWLMRVLLWLMRHEGWSYRVNVFDPSAIANDPTDPWSANCAIPELLFKTNEAFENAFPQFQILKNEIFECFLFPLSGGVIAKSPTIPLPDALLSVIARLDDLITDVFPNIFGLGRKVVIEKR
jgi:SAM-dependent methyltransferase